MPLFSPDIVASDDPAGWGMWLAGHFAEHQQFATIGLQQTPAQLFPEYDLFGWSDDKAQIRAWLDAHSAVHDALRNFTGVGGIDLGDLNTDDPGAFDEWLAYHAQEHLVLRQAFGVA